jgi:hypothetical protein
MGAETHLGHPQPRTQEGSPKGIPEDYDRPIQVSTDYTPMDYRVELVPAGSLGEETLRAWTALEERALESNGFLSPLFVLPTVRYLSGDWGTGTPQVLTVQRLGGREGRLIGAGLFTKTPPARYFPLPHLHALRSRYTSLTGLLLDRDDAENAARAVFRFLRHGAGTCDGLWFESFPVDGTQGRLLKAVAAGCGAVWIECGRTHRAVFTPSQGGTSYLEAHVPRRRVKQLVRMKRLLGDLGTVTWRILFGTEVDDRSVERFLELEHMGWKGERGSSLCSNRAHESFFREVVTGFRQHQRLFFTELLLDDSIIASTCNFISGGAGFAFKVGWHPDYAKMAPGLLNEVEFILNSAKFAQRLSVVDSGAQQGSFIDGFWAGRRILADGVFATSLRGKLVGAGMDLLRRAHRAFRSWESDRCGQVPAPNR